MSKALGERLRSVLQETVGAFVELPEDALQLGILSGKATLGPNLQVKQDFFERLGLPVVLTAGQINSIEIDIPTTHPRTKPLIVHVKQVLVTVSPNPNVNTRRARLRAHERQWQRAGLQDEFDLDSTTGKIVQKLVDNVQIVVDNIHIRLEDTHTSQTRPRSAFADTWCDGAQACYASGLVIDSFRLRSFVVNGEGSKWQETCVKKIQRFLSKNIEFGRSSRSGGISGASGIGLYVHSGEQPMADPGSSSWREAMLAFISQPKQSRGALSKSVRWLIGPSRGNMRFSADKHSELDGRYSRLWQGVDGGKYEARVRVDSLELKLRHTALRNLYGLYYFYQNVARWQIIAHLRPQCTVHGNGQRWWKFAIQCEIQEIHRKSISIEGLRKVLRDGREYVSMWTREAGLGRPWLEPLDQQERDRLQAFEDRYPVDVTMTFRVKAWRDLEAADKQRQGHVAEERDTRDALLAMPAARFRREFKPSNPDFVVEYRGTVATESGGSARKRGKDSYIAVVTLKTRSIPPLRKGWLEVSVSSVVQKRQVLSQRLWLVLTPDEIYYSVDKNHESKKTRIKLSECFEPTESSPCVFEIRTKKDKVLVVTCEECTAAQEWMKDVKGAITDRANIESVVFDPTKHLSKSNQPVDLKFTMHLKLEAASPTKSSRRKKKAVMEDVMLHLTTGGFCVCNPNSLTDEQIAQLGEQNDILRLEEDGETKAYQVTTNFPFKRLRTWSLEEGSSCCKVEVSQSAKAQASYRFFSSDTNQAGDVLEAIQLCIAELMESQKRMKQRRAEIKASIVKLFVTHAPERVDEVDALIKAHPGKKAEALLDQLQAEYAAVDAKATGAGASAVARGKASQITVVTFTEDGPLGVAFGSESDDSVGWIETIKPNGQASRFAALHVGMELIAVQQQEVGSYGEAVAAIQSARRPLTLSFRPPLESTTQSDQVSSASASTDPPVTMLPDAASGSAAAHGQMVWVGGIETKDATDGAIRSALGPLGKIVDVTVRKKPQPDKKSWALVAFSSVDSAQRALKHTEREAAGCQVTWNFDSYVSDKLDSRMAQRRQFVAEMGADKHDAAERQVSERWIVRYSGTNEDEAVDVYHLASHMVEPPSKPRKEYAYDVTLTTKHVDGTIKTLAIATSDKVDGNKLRSLLSKGSTAVNLASTPRVMPAQAKLLQSVDDLGAFRLAGEYDADDDDHDAHDSRTSRLSTATQDTSRGSLIAKDPARNSVRHSIRDETSVTPLPDTVSTIDVDRTNPFNDVVKHISIDVEQMNIDFSMATFDIIRVQVSQLHADCFDCSNDAGRAKLVIGGLLVVDRYSRDTVFPKLVCRCDEARNDSIDSGTRRCSLPGDGDWTPVDVSVDAGSRRSPSPVLPGEAESAACVEGVSVDQPAPPLMTGSQSVGARRGSLEDTASTGFDMVDPVLHIEYEQQPSADVPSYVLSKCLRLELQPLRCVVNTALIPVIQDYVKVRDFMVVQQPKRAGDCGRMAQLQRQYHSANALARVVDAHSVDILIRKPELVVPESCIMRDGDAALLVCAADKLHVKTNSISTDADDSGLTAAVVDLSLSTCGRDRWMADSSPRTPAANVAVNYKATRRGAEINHAFVADMAAEAALKGANNPILLPFSGQIRLTSGPPGKHATSAGWHVTCTSESARLRLSGQTMKDLLLIGIHAGELTYSYHNSLTRRVKDILEEVSLPPVAAGPGQSSATQHENDPGRPGGESGAGWIQRKLAQLQNAAQVPSESTATTSDQEQAVCAGELGSEPEPEMPNSAELQHTVMSATLKVNEVELIVIGEARGGSAGALNLGVRAHAPSIRCSLEGHTFQTQWTLEGLEVLAPDDDTEPGPDVAAAYAVWPRMGLKTTYTDGMALGESGAAGTQHIAVEAFRTDQPDTVTSVHSPQDLLSVWDMSELGKILPLLHGIFSESQRALQTLSSIAEQVGLESRMPRIPEHYGPVLAQMMEITATNSTTHEVVQDNFHTNEVIRSKFRALVDQQVAKYSPVLDRAMAKSGHGGAIGRLSASVVQSTVSAGTEESQHLAALSAADVPRAVGSLVQGDAIDPVEAKRDLRQRLTAASSDRLARLLAAQLNGELAQHPTTAEAGEQAHVALSQTIRSTLAESTAAGIRDIVRSIVSDSPEMDASVFKAAFDAKTQELEAALRADMEQRVDHHIASLPVDGLEAPALAALQRENARLASENARLKSENARLLAAKTSGDK